MKWKMDHVDPKCVDSWTPVDGLQRHNLSVDVSNVDNYLGMLTETSE